MANTFTSNYSLTTSEIGGDNQNWGQNLHNSLDAVDSQLINKFDKDNVKGFTSTAIIFTNTGASQGTITAASGDLFEDFEINDKIRVTGATSDTNGSTSSPSIHTITNKSNSNSITVSTGLVTASAGDSVTITLVFEPGYSDIGAGEIDGTPIGANSASTGTFTTLSTTDVSTDLIPSTDDAKDLGSSTKEWKDLYIDGTAYIDTADITNLTVAGGTGISSTPISGSTGSFTTLSVTASDTITMQNFTMGTNAKGDRTVSTSAPSGGSDGDVWYQVS
jgi:hypothetical protein